MSFDGFMTRAVSNELSNLLTGGRISKIYQPDITDLIIHTRAKGKNHLLLLSANAMFARFHVTIEKYDNPQTPPMFCMVLRKHLEGSIIEKIEQLDMERIVVFHLRGRDEIGDDTQFKLYIEVMGRHSNISLVDQHGVIIDSIKHVPPFQNSYRTILPGHPYKLPPTQNKANPFDLNTDLFLRKIDFNAGKMDHQLVNQFAGLSPQLAKEIVFRTGVIVNQKTLSTTFFEVITTLKQHQYVPEMVVNPSGKELFSMIPLTHVTGERKNYPTLSELLDRFYFGKAERDKVKQQSQELERFLRNELQKNKRKIKKLEETLQKADRASEYQKNGELLTANLHLVSRGDNQIEVIDYYDEEGKTMLIKLDPQKSPSENAQAYFRQYNKAKNSITFVKEQMKQTDEEIEYFDRLIQQMESASPRDIEEIREELSEEGYIRRQKNKRTVKPTKPQPEQYISSNGIDFLVGKNNKQNDHLTNKLARQDEIWLHTKDIPGSHVVIRSTDPDEQTLLEAATVAAYFSKARQSSSVPVDYTKIRHVKKPTGSKPGFVIYDNQTTLFVTPDEDIVRELRK